MESYHNEDSQLFTKHIDYTQGLSDVDARALLDRIDPKVVEYAEEKSYTISQFNVSFM